MARLSMDAKGNRIMIIVVEAYEEVNRLVFVSDRVEVKVNAYANVREIMHAVDEVVKQVRRKVQEKKIQDLERSPYEPANLEG